MGRRRSVKVFVFSSVVAFVGNGSNKTDIFVPVLGYLDIYK